MILKRIFNCNWTFFFIKLSFKLTPKTLLLNWHHRIAHKVITVGCSNLRWLPSHALLFCFYCKLISNCGNFRSINLPKVPVKLQNSTYMSRSSQLKKHFHKVFKWSEHWKASLNDVWFLFLILEVHTTAGASNQTMTTSLSLIAIVSWYDNNIKKKRWWWRWAKHVCLLLFW